MRLTPNFESIGDEHLKALGFGLAGAHRTGKTTVARKLAEFNDCPLIQVSLSGLASDMGIKIGLDMPWKDRVRFQEEAFYLMLDAYEQGEGQLFITDRTPLDLAAYVITAWHPSFADKAMTDWANDYVKRCMEASNAWLFQIGIVQPGIPWADAEQKGENIEFYRENLNTAIMGLAYGEWCKSPVFTLRRGTLDLDARTELLTRAYSESISQYSQANTRNFPIQ